MATFDAEMYLRRLGERLLDDPDRQDDGQLSPLRGAAEALVVAEAIGADEAWRLIDEYRTAFNIRSGEPRFVDLPAPPRRGEGSPLIPRHTMVIDQEVVAGQDRLLLRDLAITSDGATLRFRRHHDARSPGEVARRFAPGGSPWSVTSPEIVDCAGNRPVVRRGDRGSDGRDHSDGEWALRGAVAPYASWLEIDGIRVDLHRRVARAQTHLEALRDEPPAQRFLWRTLAVADRQSGRIADLEPLIQALLAAGALQDESQLVKDLWTVAARMPARPLYDAATRARSGRSLVQPWGALLRRLGRRDGPEWALVIDAITPPCDGVRVAAQWICSDLAGFEVDFEVSPHVLGAHALGETPVAWWARDDRDNHYLGVPTDWQAEGEIAQATMRYWPALDPRATRLDLLVCVDSQQAVISVSLHDGVENHV